MPDWSYHPLFKPWLSILPGAFGREFIHRGMNSIVIIPGGKQLIEFLGHMEPSTKLKKSLFSSSFSSPVGLSGKIDPNLSGTTAFSYLGFGFIEVGPVSLFKNASSEKATFNKRTQAIDFPNPLESIGIEKTLIMLKKHKARTPIFIRLNIEQNDPEDILKLTKHLQPFADVFIVEWGQFKDNIDLIEQLATDCEKPIVLAISHHIMQEMLREYRPFFYTEAIKGILIDEANSHSTAELVDSLIQLNEFGLGKVPKIVSGGVYEPEDALKLFENGADLVMLTDGYVSSGPGLPKRINEALLDSLSKEDDLIELQGWKWYWLFGFIILCGGLLALAFSMTRIILPYDEAFLLIKKEELFALNPNLLKFMSHDRMTLAGTMISGAIIYMQLAKNGVRFGMHWARKAINIAAITGFLGILLFIGYGYFDWLHGIFWIVLLPFFLWGVFQTKTAIHSPLSKNRRNTFAWKKVIWGQLCFVILGFSFVIGGIVISTIGTTSIFVSTDIGYICIPPKVINNINSNLIPVIAHDRAGFGSALLSVGLLVLMTALWGFQQGANWVWKTFLIGGIPAFSAGIFTHFIIGYTTFIHLLPAYFALIIYIIGLILSKPFLYNHSKD
ncbi:dihydroorotate dehydrogenase [Cytobacillus dafuensis]|uniref:Dihydroorotate dehydrogenase n=1 Tax=Cytobacillus dafuensis TaxID=1742359 RepID=A0A5B8Z209_CYTDA|nr:hypothetical protein [Cytobacillus dafuensis]QED47070.1 dihydroorotate dehydrogenase [Cytobacillus dafuensis]